MAKGSKRKSRCTHRKISIRRKSIFTCKKYNYDLDSISEPNADALMDESVWHEGAQKLTGAMVTMIVGPIALNEEFISIAAAIMRGLPRNITIQSIKAAEDILSSGQSGHFVTLPGDECEVVRFDTGVEAAHFIAYNPGAVPSSEDEVGLHLVDKAEQLKFFI